MPCIGRMGAAVLALALLWPGVSRGQINVSIRSLPYSNCNKVTVYADITSSHSLTSVSAAVGGVSVPLTFSTSYCSCWTGDLPLDGVSRGDFTVTVTATDSLGDSGSGQTTATEDCPPRVVVTDPAPFTIARPWLHVAATCEDDDPAGCASLGVKVRFGEFDDLVAEATGIPIEMWASLPSRGGGRVEFVATDSVGQTRVQYLYYYAEPSAELRTIELAGGLIVDVDATRILYEQLDGTWQIRERATGADTVLGQATAMENQWYGVSGMPKPLGLLTPSGALIVMSDSSTYCPCALGGSIHEWRDGALQNLGCADSWDERSLRVKGSFAAYDICFDDIYLRDLTSGTSVGLSVGTRPQFDLSSDGKVAVAALGGVTVYAGGTVTQLPSVADYSVGIDGSIVVYQKSVPGQLFMYDLGSATESVLGIEPWSDSHTLGPTFQLQDGYIAFLDLRSPDLIWQIWVRSPTGEVTRATDVGQNYLNIDRLGHGGQLTGFLPPDWTRFWAAPGPATLSLGSREGRAFHVDGQWLVAMGRNLFCVPAASTTPCPAGLVEPEPPQSDGGIADDAGADDAGADDARADDALPAADDGAAQDAGTPGGDAGQGGGTGCSGCATAPASGLAWPALVAIACLAARRRRTTSS